MERAEAEQLLETLVPLVAEYLAAPTAVAAAR
jgi:hypothetical protein